MADSAGSEGSSGPVVVCYDGSDDAIKALGATSVLFPGATALVVTAWKPLLDAILAVSLGPAPPISDVAEADERQRRAAQELAEEAAERLSKAGLEAEPLAIRAKGPVWEAIEKVAEERRARVISCGHGGSAFDLLGNTARGLVSHSNRPVTVAPPAHRDGQRRVLKQRERLASR